MQLTGDLADSEVITGPTLSVPSHALDTVGNSWFEFVKRHRGVSGVKYEAGAGAFLDHNQCVADCVLHRGPGHKDGVIAGGGCVQLGGNDNYKSDKEGIKSRTLKEK